MTDRASAVTPQDHAATVREALATCEVGVWVDRNGEEHLFDHEDIHLAIAALDALVAQAETADHWNKTANALALSIDGYEDRAETAEARLAQTQQALRFYAVEGNNDKGRIARAALAEEDA